MGPHAWESLRQKSLLLGNIFVTSFVMSVRSLVMHITSLVMYVRRLVTEKLLGRIDTFRPIRKELSPYS